MDIGAIELTSKRCRLASTVDERLAESFTDAVAVLHGAVRVVYERYFDAMRSDSLHLSMSVIKSIAGLVIGALVGRGVIEPDRLLTDYLPELRQSGFRDATVQQLLNMTASTSYWDDGPMSELIKLDIASGWRPPAAGQRAAGVLDFAKTVAAGEHLHGESFRYALALHGRNGDRRRACRPSKVRRFAERTALEADSAPRRTPRLH